MSEYRLNSGAGPGGRTDSRDPNRAVWYGLCSYWTDDWSKFEGQRSGVPTCPGGCGSPGFISTHRKWFEGAELFETNGHPDYVEFLLSIRETCSGRGEGGLTLYERWREGR